MDNLDDKGIEAIAWGPRGCIKIFNAAVTSLCVGGDPSESLGSGFPFFRDMIQVDDENMFTRWRGECGRSSLTISSMCSPIALTLNMTSQRSAGGGASTIGGASSLRGDASYWGGAGLFAPFESYPVLHFGNGSTTLPSKSLFGVPAWCRFSGALV